MYYVVIKSFGANRCLDKNTHDVFGRRVDADCTLNLNMPNNVVYSRDISVRCLQGQTFDGKVFVDFATAKKTLSLTSLTTIKNVNFSS